MANTGTGQLANSIQSKQINARIVKTAYARTVLDAIAAGVAGGYGEGGSGHDFITGATARAYPRLNKVVAAGFTEGLDGVPVALGDTQVTITPVECGIGVDLTDSALASLTPQNYKNYIVQLMGKAYGDYVDSQGLAQASSATVPVGTAEQSLTEDVVLSGLNKLDVANAEAPIMAIYSATAVHNLRSKFAGSSPNTSHVYQRADILSRIGPALPSAFAMTLYEMDIFKSTNVPTANTSTDTFSMMFTIAPGMFPFMRLIRMFPGLPANAAQGVEQVQSMQQDDPVIPGGVWDGRYEEQRDASLRATEMWVTGAWAWGTVAPDWVIAVTSVK
jgi:hypothetical protein